MIRVGLLYLLSVMALFALEKSDFAYMRAVEKSPTNGIVQIELPFEMYKHLNYKDLSDLAVFDAHDKQMPHTFGFTYTKRAPYRNKNLPFVLLDTLKKTPSNSIKVRLNGKEVEIQEHPKQGIDREYIVDTSSMKEGIDEITINFSNRELITDIKLYCSDDLTHWSRVAGDFTLANLNLHDTHIIKNQLTLHLGAHHYLKLQMQKPLDIKSISAIRIGSSQQTTKRLVLPLHKKDGGIEFSLSKNVLVDHLEFVLSSREQLYRFNLLVKDEKGQWHVKRAFQIYNLQNGRLTQLSLALDMNDEAYAIEAVEGSYMPDDIQLYLHYRPHKLFFLAQGDAPYSILYSSIKHAKKYPYLGKIITLDKKFVKSGVGHEEVSNPKANKIKKPYEYKVLLVWFSLVLGVSVLGLISYRLYISFLPR